jgi:hypothetical protein
MKRECVRPGEPGCTLFGRKPTLPETCCGCDTKAEIYRSYFCWTCCATGIPLPGGRRAAVRFTGKAPADWPGPTPKLSGGDPRIHFCPAGPRGDA